jgi:hypothetical protein
MPASALRAAGARALAGRHGRGEGGGWHHPPERLPGERADLAQPPSRRRLREREPPTSRAGLWDCLRRARCCCSRALECAMVGQPRGGVEGIRVADGPGDEAALVRAALRDGHPLADIRYGSRRRRRADGPCRRRRGARSCDRSPARGSTWPRSRPTSSRGRTTSGGPPWAAAENGW